MFKLKYPKLPTVQEIIKLYGLSAKQKLSQNFILDLNVTAKIARSAGDLKDCTVIEVGAGPGSLTRSLLFAGAKKVIAVEKDKRFQPALEMLRDASDGRLDVIIDDMLLVDEARLLEKYVEPIPWEETSNIKIVGNLPFGVGSQLLLKWIKQIPYRTGAFKYARVPFTLLYQKEVADRLTANVNFKSYGRLSVMVQHCAKATHCFDLAPKSFVPAPEVHASCVNIEPLIDKKFDVNLDALEWVCRELSTCRRKTVSNAIKKLGPNSEEFLKIANIPLTKRPQEITIEEWCRLANLFSPVPSWQNNHNNNNNNNNNDLNFGDIKNFENQSNQTISKEKKLQEKKIIEKIRYKNNINSNINNSNNNYNFKTR
eukprot:TRINITY_DN1108_c0_g2_i5.p1 TRINITY_DN1108_c0_g2~~TRINITY_DN1108_c0_g2_i5.p1  ORF type:complete len:370 (+),score=145.65 TRINITY_DN1108_c0_g2_i5:97-1206(+)